MNGIVRRVDGKRAAVDGDAHQALDTLGRAGFIGAVATAAARGQHEIPARDAHVGESIHGVSPRVDVDVARRYRDVPLRGVFLIIGLQAIALRFHAQAAVAHHQIILPADAIIRRADRDHAPGDDQPVFAGNAIQEIAAHRQRAAAVNAQVGFAVNGRVGFIGLGGLVDVLPGIRDGVLRAIGQEEDHLFRLDHVQGGAGRTAQVHAVQHQFHRFFITGIDQDLPIRQRAAQAVRTGSRDGGGASVYRHARAARLDRIAVQRNHHRRSGIVDIVARRLVGLAVFRRCLRRRSWRGRGGCLRLAGAGRGFYARGLLLRRALLRRATGGGSACRTGRQGQDEDYRECDRKDFFHGKSPIVTGSITADCKRLCRGAGIDLVYRRNLYQIYTRTPCPFPIIEPA